MFFRKPSAPKGGARAVVSPPFERRRDGWRCVVETLVDMRLDGWATSAGGRPADLQLRCADVALPSETSRRMRDDVLAHLGAPAGSTALGFSVELPVALWDHAAPDGSVAFHLQVDGDDRDMPLLQVGPSHLLDWLERVLALTDSDTRSSAWSRLQPHLRRTLPPEHWDQAHRRWLAADAAHREKERLPGARLKWTIEKQDLLCLVGWAADPNGGDEDFGLACNGQPHTASVIRFERADVREMLGPVRLDSGFELALPASLWAAIPDGETGQVQLSLAGRPLLDPPLALSRAGLAQMVADTHAKTAEWAAQDPAELHYQSLLLLEHAVAAGIAPLLAAAPAAWLEGLAVKHGLGSSWPAPPAPASGSAAPAGTAPGESPEDTAGSPIDRLAGDPVPLSPQALNQAIWQLQRRFNDALATPAQSPAELIAALDRSLEAGGEPTETTAHAASEAQRRFLVSMVPFFCAADALPALRPRLDAAELHTLTLAHGRWELSLLLPVTLLDEVAAGDGRLARSAALMERIAAATDAGWLNSAAVLDALRRLASAQRTQPLDDAELERFVDATTRLFDSLGAGHGSRLYDEHLLHAAGQCLALAALASDALLQRCADTLVRHCALTPVFWQVLTTLQPATAWPASLRLARHHFERLLAAWTQLEAGDTQAGPVAGAALRGLRELGCADVDSLQRHALLLAARHLPPAGSREAARGLRGLPPQDALRWLGRLPDALPSLAPAHDAETLLRLAGPVPSVAHTGMRRAAQASLAALRAALAEGSPDTVGAAAVRARQDALAISGEHHGFVGLRGLAQCAAWLHGAAARSGGVGVLTAETVAMVQALCSAADRALAASERGRQHHPMPGAALVAALSWLAWLERHDPQACPAADLSAFLQDCALRLRAAWHDDAAAALVPLPATTVLASAAPGLDTLVLVRSDADGAPSRCARIQQGWGGRLAREGTAWMLWCPRAGATEIVRPATTSDPVRVHAASLAALLGWLLEHSDFGQLLLLDDDAELDVDAWLQASGAPAHHYHGLAEQPGPAAAAFDAGGAPLLDKSPPNTRFASLANGLSLSRYAVQRALTLKHSVRGARLARGASNEEKWLGDLMALAGIRLSDQGHRVHQRRPPRPGFAPPAFHNFYLPSPQTDTVLTHADTSAATPAHAPGASPAFLPRRLWPTDRAPRLANDGSALQLVELSPPGRADGLAEAACTVVAVARNERLLMPHFLAHYRQLGASHFVIVDNLSDDGTREYLLEQPDVVVYSADTPYGKSRYGVIWQQTVLAAHATGRWALVADIDEFLVWPGCETESLPQLCDRLHTQGADAARVLMVDMYPQGPLADADFGVAAPFQAAPCFDARAVLRWRLGSGSYSNGPSWVSGLRHRLLPGSAPNHYTSQKIALIRHRPWVRCSEGLHYAAGLSVARGNLAFAHFKYHRGFHAKVLAEVARKQHYNGAEEYRQYLELLSEARGSFFDPRHSLRYENSQSFAPLLQ